MTQELNEISKELYKSILAGTLRVDQVATKVIDENEVEFARTDILVFKDLVQKLTISGYGTLVIFVTEDDTNRIIGTVSRLLKKDTFDLKDMFNHADIFFNPVDLGPYYNCDQLRICVKEQDELTKDNAVDRSDLNDLYRTPHLEARIESSATTIEQTPRTPAVKEFQIWVEGYSCTGQYQGAKFLGTSEGVDFNAAVRKFIFKEHLDFDDIKYDEDGGFWSRWGCRLYDNEKDARKAFG